MMDKHTLQNQRNAEHVMFCRLANQARTEGKIQLAETYEAGAAMIARLYHETERES